MGFACPLGFGNVKIEYCLKGCPAKPRRCMTVDMLLAMHSDRIPEPRIYHVTELRKTVQQVYLARNRDFFVSPYSMAAMSLGSGLHAILEGEPGKFDTHGYVEDAVREASFSVEILTRAGKATLTGRVDKYSKTDSEITDYKTGKVYQIKKLREGGDDEDYFWQLNTYRVYGFPAEKMTLEFQLKDWSPASLLEDGVLPIERIDVPKFEDEKVRDAVTERLAQFLESERDPLKVGTCGVKDRWFRDIKNWKFKVLIPNVPMKCLSYCQVRDVCPQHKEWKESNGNRKDFNLIEQLERLER